MRLSSKKAIFLDKDGTLNYSVFWKNKFRAPRNITETFFYKGLSENLQTITKLDYLVFLVTNQPDISSGDIKLIDYSVIVNHVEKNFNIAEVATCIHLSKLNCLCRKPNPKMLFDLSAKYNIELKNSWMIGDRISDTNAGKSAGCKTILIERNPPILSVYDFAPDYLVTSTNDAIIKILEENKN
jgi:D-glycero-D-manno-heptose 1,7-bisphosphate phosphatase